MRRDIGIAIMIADIGYEWTEEWVGSQNCGSGGLYLNECWLLNGCGR